MLSRFRLGVRVCVRMFSSSSSSSSSSLEETGADGEVLTQKLGHARFITLNRPKALNALNLPQIRYLYPKYKEWDEDEDTKVIVLRGTGSKAFCAGGDIRAIYDSGSGVEGVDPSITKKFFFEEYKLNHRISILQTPQVALLDGITMGGGVGLSVHGKVRVAFESSIFAMPETAIGFFCDVGGSYFLSHLPHNFGVFLGLTGARLRGVDLVHFGIATHFSPLRTPELESALQDVERSTTDAVDKVLKRFEPQGGLPWPTYSIEQMKEIEHCFGAETVEEIIKRTQQYESEDWAKTAIKGLQKASPSSLKVVLKSLQIGKTLSFAECLKMEYRISQAFMLRKDFFTGVRATLIDRDPNPKWNPASLEEVTDEDVQKYFLPLSPESELKFDEWDWMKRAKL